MKTLMGKRPKKRSSAGFTLVEVLIALAIGSLCLISVYGLLSVALYINQNLVLESEATEIISSVVQDVCSTPSTAANSVRYQVTLPTAGSTSATTTALYFDRDGNNLPDATSAIFSLSLTIQPPLANQKQATILSAVAYWPPYSVSETASQKLAQHSIQFTTALDRN